jgi:hypothetical protein
VYDVATAAIKWCLDDDEYGNVKQEWKADNWTPIAFGYAGGLCDRDTRMVRRIGYAVVLVHSPMASPGPLNMAFERSLSFFLLGRLDQSVASICF